MAVEVRIEGGRASLERCVASRVLQNQMYRSSSIQSKKMWIMFPLVTTCAGGLE